jgi:DNA polymerase-3 subunit delta'
MGFESFLGNARAVAAVREMLARGRVPGALLFAGPDGVGKKTLAVMLAKTLNCERRGPGQSDFCGECGRCRRSAEMLAAARDDAACRREIKEAARRVEGLIYFDLQLIEPITRFILIEQVRQMRSVAYTHPFELARRVFILDQAQAVHWQAVDLLLKMLEEPPETTTIILVCPNAYELRPTIRSRCTRVQFVAVEEAVIAELVGREKPVSPSQKALATRVAGGSVARAKAFDPGDFEARRRPWLAFLENLASGARYRGGDAAARGEGAGGRGGVDWKALFDATRTLTENDFEETLRIGYTLLRDLLILLEGGPDHEVVNVDLQARLKTWARQLGGSGIEKLKTGLDEAHRLQTRNVNQQLGLDALAVEVLAGAGLERPWER